MKVGVSEASNRWITVQRFKPIRRWPRSTQWPVLNFTRGMSGGNVGQVQSFVFSWGDDNEAGSSQVVPKYSPLALRDNRPEASGIEFVHGQPSSSLIKFTPEKANPGELDILTELVASCSVSRAFAEVNGSVCGNYVRGVIGTMLRDPLSLVGPVNTYAPGTRSLVLPPFDTAVFEGELQDDEIRAAFDHVRTDSNNPFYGYTDDQRRAVGLASRRILGARLRADPIDRYIDYWVSCEFLACNPIWKGKGDKALRIAGVLATSTGIDRELMKPKIKRLWEIRKGIVHHAIEGANEFQRHLTIVRFAAEALLDHRFGLSDNGNFAKALNGEPIAGCGIIMKAHLT